MNWENIKKPTGDSRGILLLPEQRNGVDSRLGMMAVLSGTQPPNGAIFEMLPITPSKDAIDTSGNNFELQTPYYSNFPHVDVIETAGKSKYINPQFLKNVPQLKKEGVKPADLIAYRWTKINSKCINQPSFQLEIKFEKKKE